MTVTVDLRPLRRDLADAVEQHGRRSSQALEAFENLFRTAAASGQPLDELRRYSKNEAERFFANTIPGPDGHVYWDGGRDFKRNDGRKRRPRRWWWAHLNGRELDHCEDLVPMCGDTHCINPGHAQVGRDILRRKFSNERIIGALQVVAMRLGHSPSTREWTEGGNQPSVDVIRTRLGGGSWAQALAAAGLEYEQYYPGSQPTTREQCIASVRYLRHKLGRTPESWDLLRHRQELRARGLPSSRTTIRKHVGRWPDVIKALIEEDK